MIVRFLLRRHRRVNPTASLLQLNWSRFSEWLTDMEERVPDGVYLDMCTLLKRLYSAHTREEQRSYLHELEVLEATQWSFFIDPLAC